ncbi:hypothetical protein H6758_02910 [Candidatus Nomurabacteria bacterium]|nr:hypothetical protein [Candidatus Nomurabacteria bacterium]
MNTKFKILFLSFTLTIGVLLGAGYALANDYGLGATAGAAGLTNSAGGNDVPTILGNVIGTALSVVSIVFFILMIYGGFLWMTAHGKSDQTSKALDTIIAAVIGIIIVLGAYALTQFVFDNIAGGGGAGGGVAPSAADLKPNDTSCNIDADCQSGACVLFAGAPTKLCSAPGAIGEECQANNHCVTGNCQGGQCADGGAAAGAGAGADDLAAQRNQLNAELQGMLQLVDGFATCIDDGDNVGCDDAEDDFGEQITELGTLIGTAQATDDIAQKEASKIQVQTKIDAMAGMMRNVCDQDVLNCAARAGR